MKLLGIDYGRRRIGVAATDSSGIAVRGITTIDRLKHKDPFTPLINLINNESPEKIVFGVPLTFDDQETVMSNEVRKFAADLSEKLDSSLPIDFIDESYSSIEADKHLSFRKKKQRRDKGNRDRIAACNILVMYQREQECDLQ